MTELEERSPYERASDQSGYPVDNLITNPLEGRRRRRRQRTVHRVRYGLGLAAILIGATTFSALPIADDIRVNTLEFLSITESEPEVQVASEVELEEIPASIEFDTSVWVDPRMVGMSPPNVVEGLLTFRGSPTRSFYGQGPIPDDPEIMWRYPEEGGLCRRSTVGAETKVWCGTGWTGQAALFERDDQLWAVFGALDGAVHFIDALTGEQLLEPFQTDDIIKGSVTIDPDGFPIVYTGSRDNKYRAIAFDGDQARQLWALDARDVEPTLWNNDWDGAGLVLDDYLFIGGENSRIHIAKLNRGYNSDGEVTVEPDLVFHAAGWDDELRAAVGDNVSIENSVAISGDTLYFANSGGLIQGWNIAGVKDGEVPERTFRYWAGDDVDATLVIDEEGMLYAGVEYERNTTRSRDLGQLIKLDPTKSGDDALIWGVQERQGINTGVWGTPALYANSVIFGSEGGNLRAVDRTTGEDLWSIKLGFHLWQSPVVIDDTLLMGNCSGVLRSYTLSPDGAEPKEDWALELDDGCIESTPAVWDGTIVVGTRLGGVYGIRQAGT